MVKLVFNLRPQWSDMKNDIRQVLTLAVLGCALGNAFGQPAAAANTAQKSNQFVVQAEAAYKGMLEAERAGNLTSYRKFRSKAALDEILGNLRKTGTPESEAGAALQRVSKYSTSLDGFDFVRAEGRASVGRLFYQKRWKSNGEEMVDFFGYLMRLEDNTWKVDCVVNSTGTKFGMGKSRKIEERTIDEVAEHPCLKMS